MNLARSKDEWLAARKKLLAKEKELTHLRDALSAERRAPLAAGRGRRDNELAPPTGPV